MIRALLNHKGRFLASLLMVCMILVTAPLSHAVEQEQSDDEFRVERGLAEDEYEAAVEKMLQALEVDPTNGAARRSLAKAYYYLDEFGQALEAQKIGIEIAPEPNDKDYRILGLIYKALGDDERSIEAFTEVMRLCRIALDLNPDNIDARRRLALAYFNLDEFERALEEQKTVMEMTPEPIEDDYHTLGAIYAHLENKEGQLEAFGKGAAIFGTERLWFKLALIHGSLDDYESEIYAYRRVLELNPDDYYGRRNLSDAYSNLEEYERALEEQETAIGMTEEPSPKDYYKLWMIYEKLDDKENMRRTFDEATTLFGPERAWQILAAAYNDIEDYVGAVDASRKVLELNPDNVAIRFLLAGSLFHLEEYRQALEEQETAIETAPDANETDYFNLGGIYSQLEDSKGAVDAYRKTLELDPDYEDARLNLVHNLYRIEDYEAAVGELSRLYPSRKDRASFVLSTLRHLIFPFLILSLLLFLSRNRRISPYFCNSGQGEEDILKTLMVIMSIFALSLLAAPLFHNPFARNYGEKVVITLVLDASLLKEDPGRYFLAGVLSNLIVPAYYMSKCGISIGPLFAVDWSMLKRTGKYLLAGLFLFIALAVPLSLTLTLAFPAELEAHDQIIKALNESIQTYSLFGKIRLGLLGPFMEEFCFRGMVFLLLRRRFKVLWSIVFSALLFAASHYFYGTISLIGVFTFGIVAAYLLHKTRSLWPPYIFHALYNSIRFLT